jgi:integrase
LFSALPELYRDLAMTQFYCAGRIGEVAGIQIQNIYFDQEFLLIKESIVWTDVNKTFSYLKTFLKNRETRRVHLHAALREIIDRRMKDLKLAAHYSKIDGEVQKDTSLKILAHIQQLGLREINLPKDSNVIPFKRVKGG